VKVLLVGGGGREHAIGWKIAQSPLLSMLYLIPGNPGLDHIGVRLQADPNDITAILAQSKEKSIDLVIVGPEAPLAQGLADLLEEANIPCFGPKQAAARLESSKSFMKDLCLEANIPTAKYATFTQTEPAIAYLDTLSAPFVIKADGLAAGKGVIIAQTRSGAESAISSILTGQFGGAGEKIIIEEFMEGEEASFFAICDGKTALPLIAAQDHKRAFEGDRGPNTGGMGAFSPTPAFTSEIEQQVMTQIINPTIKAMADRGTPFCGVLFAGLMLTPQGPKLIEYNVRFGDPECQVLMKRLNSDLLPVLHAAAIGKLENHSLDWSPDSVALIVMAANGYPEAYKKGTPINNIEQASNLNGITIFHAGTKIESDQLLANGGRVLNITAKASNINLALDHAYEAVDLIDWSDGFYRRDIGWRVRET